MLRKMSVLLFLQRKLNYEYLFYISAKFSSTCELISIRWYAVEVVKKTDCRSKGAKLAEQLRH